MAMDDIERMKEDGLEISPLDIIRLNAFGLKVEKSSESSEMYVMQRAAFLDELVFHQPTIGDEIYKNEVSRIYDLTDTPTFMLIMSYILTTNQDNRPSSSDKKGIAEEVEKTKKGLLRVTEEQVWNCLDYVINGNLVYEGEDPPAKKEDKKEKDEFDVDEPIDNDSYPTLQIALIRQGQLVGLGSPEELSKLTTIELQTLVQYKVAREIPSIMKNEHTRKLGEYYQVLDEVKNKAMKIEESKQH